MGWYTVAVFEPVELVEPLEDFNDDVKDWLPIAERLDDREGVIGSALFEP